MKGGLQKLLEGIESTTSMMRVSLQLGETLTPPRASPALLLPWKPGHGTAEQLCRRAGHGAWLRARQEELHATHFSPYGDFHAVSFACDKVGKSGLKNLILTIWVIVEGQERKGASILA